eukprot:gene3501-38447_t
MSARLASRFRRCREQGSARKEGLTVPRFRAAGGDGFIILNIVPLVAPTSSKERVRDIVRCALYPSPGFRKEEAAGAKESRLAECRQVVQGLRDAVSAAGRSPSDLPIVVGFGISTRADVEGFGKFADGAVVGSKIVAALVTVLRPTPHDAGDGGVAAAAAVVRELSAGPAGADGAEPSPPAKRPRTDAPAPPPGGDPWCFGGT